MLHHVVPEIVANQVGVPDVGGQQVLHPIGGGVPRLLRQLPAVLAFHGTEQPPQVVQRPPTRLGTPESSRNALVYPFDSLGPTGHLRHIFYHTYHRLTSPALDCLDSTRICSATVVLTPLEARSLGAAKCGAGCDILGQTGKECHGDISDNSWGHLGPEGVTFSTGGVTFSTVLGDTAMSPEPLEPSIKPSTEPLINCQGAREKIPEKTDPVPSIAVEAVEATGGPDIPPPRRRRPSEPRTPPTVTEEFRARMRQKHLGEGFDVNTEIDRALNHEAVLKAIKVELYVQNWLRRQAQ